MELLLAVKNDENGSERHVYSTSKKDHFVVVKTFGPEASKIRTIKIWAGSSLEKTASYWNTKTKIEITPEVIAADLQTIRELALLVL